MKRKKIFVILAVVLGATLSAFCIFTAACCDPTLPATKAVMVVGGYEWGPAISQVVVEFDGNISGVDKDTFEIALNDKSAAVTGAYISDAAGAASDVSPYLTLTLETKPDLPSPFRPDPSGSGHNLWTDTVKFALSLKSGKTAVVDGQTYDAGNWTYELKTKERRSPDTDVFAKDSFTYRDGAQNITLTRGAFSPDGAANDDGKNPLVVWLHGLGEGGADIDIALLGNEVTALTRPGIQKYFTTETQKGAYVLAVQCPTMWMDADGSGATSNDTVNDGREQTSYYTAALMASIEDYVQNNPDVDTEKIYVGGCSNGGYMTLNLMYRTDDYFAAYYPICEGYNNRNISDEMIKRTKDLHVWFLQSNDDTTLPPRKSTLPTFYRYIAAGAENMFLTLTEKVTGTNGDRYLGHFSWVYAFNDEVGSRFNNERVKDDLPNVEINASDGTISGTAEIYLQPGNCIVKDNMWEWLAAQRKTAA